MNMKRMRGRNHRPNGGGGGGTGGGFRNQQNGIPLNRNHVFDSSGPEMRVRGTAQQLYEKYQQMARDASSNGDRVTGEAYYQHAEHYFRIIAAINQAQGQPNQPAGQPQNGGQPNQERGNYQPQQNGGQHERTDYPRRDYNNNGNQNEQPQHAEGHGEVRQEQRPQDSRPQENQQNQPQNQQPRRYEQRSYEPRQPKPEYQPRERNEQRPRPETVVDSRIDISSALEAELAAAAAPAGYGEQPAIAPVVTPEPQARAIPIIPDAPPAVAAAPELTLVAPRVPKPRGRPKVVKPVVEKAGD